MCIRMNNIMIVVNGIVVDVYRVENEAKWTISLRFRVMKEACVENCRLAWVWFGT